MGKILVRWFPGTPKYIMPGVCKCFVKICNTQILKNTFVYIFVFKRALSTFAFNSTCFTFLSSCPYLHLILWIPSARWSAWFNNELAINLAVWINCHFKNMVFAVSSPFLLIPLTSFVIGNEKVLYVPVFSFRQLNPPSSSLLALLW